MAPSTTLVRESPASRWFRRSVPFWILLGIAFLISMPGVLNGPDDRDTPSDDIDSRPISQFALSDDTAQGRAGR